MDGVMTFLPEVMLWGSLLYFWILLIGLFGLFFYSEKVENGFIATISFVIFSIIVYKWSDLDFVPFITWGTVSLYLGIGLVYAFIKTYFYGRKSNEKLIYKYTYDKKQDDAEKEAKRIKEFRKRRIESLKGNVFRWWLLWPVSLLTWIFSDLLRDLYNWAYSKLRVVFEYVFDAGFKTTHN